MKAKSSGFTLLEIMMVVALLAVLIGIGAPSMGEFIRNSRITGKANDLLAGLNLARTEAIKRHVPVTVCATADATAATPTCAVGEDFSEWFAFVDDGGDPADVGNVTFEPDEDEVLLVRSSDTVGSITTIPAADVEGYIQFGMDGFQRRDGGDAPVDLGIVMCDERGNKAVSGSNISAARALFISRTGRAEVSRALGRIDDLLDDLGGSCP
jgi:type IV fimbrial biogenesis protein FimT